MGAEIISGAEVAKDIRAELKTAVEELKAEHKITPGLVTILVGENPASMSYVTGKQKTAKELGFYSVQENMPAAASEDDLLAMVERYNADEKIHGILVQLPLPAHINESKVLLAIDPKKDVDGFHPISIGKLLLGEDTFPPCTPAGIMELIKRSVSDTKGAEVVVVGRSNIVGKPIAMMMAQKGEGANATVTICHTGTKDIASHTKRADILIVAAGRPNTVTADMVKPGAVVIDVGVNRIGKKPDGKNLLAGDVDFEGVKEVASKITPVPGGVGPMTITMLMKNTYDSAKASIKK